jgi:hypothetical protein
MRGKVKRGEIKERMEREGKKMTEAGENVLPTTASLELEIYVAC